MTLYIRAALFAGSMVSLVAAVVSRVATTTVDPGMQITSYPTTMTSISANVTFYTNWPNLAFMLWERYEETEYETVMLITTLQSAPTTYPYTFVGTGYTTLDITDHIVEDSGTTSTYVHVPSYYTQSTTHVATGPQTMA